MVIVGGVMLDFIHVSVKHRNNVENIYVLVAMCKISFWIDDGSIF